MSKSKYDIILFDLDGTLSQSADGIRDTIEYSLRQLNADIPDLSDYSLYIGPPLRQTFLNICSLTNTEADSAVEIYRKRYDEHGKYLNKLYDGMERVLSVLKDSGAKLAVASSKYEPFTKEIINILKIEKYFDAVCGSNRDETRKEKRDLIPYAINCLNGNINDRTVMIGDTKYDALGAKQTGVDFIGVTYGYGKAEDMIKVGGDRLAATPSEILKFLLD